MVGNLCSPGDLGSWTALEQTMMVKKEEKGVDDGQQTELPPSA